MNISRLELLINMGFERDPFKNVDFKTSDGMRIEKILNMAVKSNAMISIVGDRGAGKTRAVAGALKKMDAQLVVVRSADKSRVLIGDVEQAMILDLSDERPKRYKELRSRQLRRILGEASRQKDIVIIIEEAHRLHGMTLRALKTLRELDWMGETELFTCVLLGQSDPMNKAGVSEVRLRSDTVRMHGLSKKEIAGYIREVMGSVFEADAIQAVSHLSDTSNFLDLQSTLITIMASAAVAGRDTVTIEDVLESGKEERAEIGGQGSEGRGQRAEGRGQRAGIRGRKSGNDALKDMLDRRESKTDTDNSTLRVAV